MPAKSKQILNSTVEIFFDDMIRREGLKVEAQKEIFNTFLAHVQSQLEDEEQIVATIEDDQVLEAFIKTICIQLYEEYAKQLRSQVIGDIVTMVTSDIVTGSIEAGDIVASIPPFPPISAPPPISTPLLPPPPPPPIPPQSVLGSCQPRNHKNNRSDFKAAHKLKIRTHRQVGNDSLWAQPYGDLIKEAQDSFTETDFLRLFCLPTSQKHSTLPALSQSSTSMAVICLLDTKRSNNISIALSRMKSVEEVCELMGKIEEANLPDLSEDDLTALIKSEPTAQELKLLNEFKGPVEMLNFPEKVLYQFSLRPGLPWMLRAVRYMQKVPGWLDDCKRGLTILSATYQCLLSSPAVLKLMLSARRLHELNNVVFGDGRPVQGIALEGILEFSRLESVDGSHLPLAAYLTQRLPQLPQQLKNDLESVLKEAIQVDWTSLGSLLADIQAGLAHFTSPQTIQLSRAFTIRKTDFIAQFEDSITALASAHAACAQEWKNVCTYFELDQAEYTPTDFFLLWTQILKGLCI